MELKKQLSMILLRFRLPQSDGTQTKAETRGYVPAEPQRKVFMRTEMDTKRVKGTTALKQGQKQKNTIVGVQTTAVPAVATVPKRKSTPINEDPKLECCSSSSISRYNKNLFSYKRDESHNENTTVKVVSPEKCQLNGTLPIEKMSFEENPCIVSSNNNIDFIEMCTLDAKEFLKCGCSTTNSDNFRKDCFRNFKKSTDNNNDITTLDCRDEKCNNDRCLITGDLCEIAATTNNNGSQEIDIIKPTVKQKDNYKTNDCCDKTLSSENCCATVNCYGKNDGVQDEKTMCQSETEENIQVIAESEEKTIDKSEYIEGNCESEQVTTEGKNEQIIDALLSNEEQISINEESKLSQNDQVTEEIEPKREDLEYLLDTSTKQDEELMQPKLVIDENESIPDLTNNVLKSNSSQNVEKLNNCTCKLLESSSSSNELFCNILKAIQKNCQKYSTGIPEDVATNLNDLVRHIYPKKYNCESPIYNDFSLALFESNLDPKNLPQLRIAGQFSDESSTVTTRIFSSNDGTTTTKQQEETTYDRESCASLESIDTDEQTREQAPICSRESDVDVVVSDAAGRRLSQQQLSNTSPSLVNSSVTKTGNDSCTTTLKSDKEPINEELLWRFENGRLVFESKSNLDQTEEQVVCAQEDDLGALEVSSLTTDAEILSSKCLNKRSDESASRLRHLKDKLKKAGITDTKENDSSPETKNPINEEDEQFQQEQQRCSFIEYKDFETNDAAIIALNKSEAEELIPDVSNNDTFCQFNVSEFAAFNANNLKIYDEFIEHSSSDDDDADSCECEEEHFIVIRRMRGDGTTMVNNEASERSKHNPDRDNLKSLLKKPGRGAKSKKSNRVVFNENKNEFFDADYIILIREDCDLDDDEDDGICTCQQHEMVRLTCCEPNCSCQYDLGPEPTPQSPKFAPPIEFVDAVTLSPPEGYKDMELFRQGHQQQRGAVCRECSVAHGEEIEEDGEASQSDSEMDTRQKRDEQEEKEKTDQSQQTTPTTPPKSEYIFENMSNKQLRDVEESNKQLPPSQGSPISGILKGGRLWKQQSLDVHAAKPTITDSNILSSDSVTSDEEGNNKRSVRFIESEEKRACCDGAPESLPEEKSHPDQPIANKQTEQNLTNSPDAPEMTLTFKLGHHVLISNNSLKPNSAVRQLFPCTKTLGTAQGGVYSMEEASQQQQQQQQYLVTAESLRAFEEAKRSKLPQMISSGETDETIKRAIERNTLRRSLIRYEPKSKKQPYKNDNSLVERIKQLTCNVDSNEQKSSIEKKDSEDVPDSRASPPGEEAKNSLDVARPGLEMKQNFSPSSSSTASSSSSMSINQNYQQPPQQMRKLSATGEQILIDARRSDNLPDIQNNFRKDIKHLPDVAGSHNHEISEPTRAIPHPPDLNHCLLSNKISSSSNSSESRRQFLSTFAPLTACVTMGIMPNEDYYYHLTNQPGGGGERVSIASSGTEYSLEDIDEGLKNDEDEQKKIAPDVLAGTPSASESGDELAMFVQQDAGRIERIKKKYQPAESKQESNKATEDDDENDDYGFNRRPSVRGIKPRFGTTTEILQQIQNQLQPPPPPPSARVAWPYYSESGLTDNSKQRNANPPPSSNYHYINVGEETVKTRGGYPAHFRPTSLQDTDGTFQNCANQRCVSRDTFQSRSNSNIYSSTIRMGNDYYQSLPRQKNGRPQSPPPMDMSKQYHQTMVYIPYNHIEGYQPVQYYHNNAGTGDYASRVSSHNQINKRYVEPIYQSRVHHQPDEHHFNNPNIVLALPPKTLNRLPFPNSQVVAGSRSESPLPGQFSTARSTQTSTAHPQCGYYPPRYRPMVAPTWQGDGNYVTKLNRHSFPNMAPRYPAADTISLTDSDSQHSGSLQNGFRQSDISMYASKNSISNSPTKPRFIERGVPEGAASVSPQDASGISQSSSSTMTSPTSPQNPVPANQKPLFYAMNV
ncbi:hypothetical protein ABEB36_009890 [Hypothenemus hampei]|uniref:Uncharacterized protein n=1 Tax=Hypothenemus hampei TaxID=57062 RepID=A0ABD1EIB4_HYPHA